MLIHHPNITSRNVMTTYYDAANPKSYPGAGSNFYSLTNNKYTISTTAGVTYSKSFGGMFTLNGTSTQSISLPVTSSLGLPSGGTSNPFTMEFWIRASNLSARQAMYNSTLSLNITVETTGAIKVSINATQVSITSSGLVNAGQWYHITVSRDSSCNYITYINGISLASGTNTTSVTNTRVSVGATTSSTIYFAGDIAILKTYIGTVLTPTQILQNFNAIKGRFGY